jgi:cbb3-type cytochrome oxidase cytochrome c subunit
MPATEETYRPQPILHLIFAISSVAMLLATVWMVMADHLRPWKQVQREFQSVEREKLEATLKQKQEEQKQKYQSQLDEVNRQIQQAERGAEERAADIRGVERDLNKLGGRVQLLDMQRRFKKADLDSKRSLYDGMIERNEEGAARAYLSNVVAGAERELDGLTRQLEAAEKEKKAAEARKEGLLSHVDDLKKERDRLTREVDRVNRAIEQKNALYGGPDHWYSAPMAFFRSLPGVDLMPPTKIQQLSLPELTINYNFKEVPRYDRCTTCHQGIDRIGYDKAPDGVHDMKKVFASHPFLTSGATTVDPKGNVVPAGLYLDGNGPHPINAFGCTICHGGQGSGTDFTLASHTPDSLEQAKEWHEEYGWHSFHFWDYPMLQKKFLESSCLKCHHEVTDVPQARTLQAGYQRIVKYGCTGCHTIGGEGSFGPDLTDEPAVGPNLSHVASKVSQDWIRRWIIDPHAFRPDSRMPRFYGVTNNSDREDWPKNYAEANAITHYLFAKSTEPPGFDDPPKKTDPAKGKELFLQKGCMACHQHRPYQRDEIQQADRGSENPAYKPDASATYDPRNFPASVRDDAMANYGPNLSNIAAKFQSQPQGLKWLANWIHAPEKYHPKSLMPNLQLSFEDASDIASWIISVPGEWPVKVEVPGPETKDVMAAVDDLIELYITKSGNFKHADGKIVSVSLSEIDAFIGKLGAPEKLMYLGERTISRLGCFGCHTIPGFENAKPIGTALNDWGLKNPARLDFGHIREYLLEQSEAKEQPDDERGTRDGTPPEYQDELAHETRIGFLFQKLHRPRSYDFLKKSEKYKPWDDRLRMPQFAWANDRRAVEEIMTFVLGLTGERVNARYLPKTHYGPAQFAMARGARVINRHNCTGCHVLEMPRFEIPAGTKVSEAFTNFATNLRSSYNGRENDYLAELYPGLTHDPKKKLDSASIEGSLGLKPDDGSPITIEGMPTDLIENELTVQIWRPVTIRGYTFNVGDNMTLDVNKIKREPGEGGGFAWLYAATQKDRNPTAPFESFWNRLPPPLIREGLKVQTPWLTGFLKDPYAIRPAAQLRMPRFHYHDSAKAPSRETDELANYFAARDRAEFPYQAIDQQRPSYLSERSRAHPNYLGAGWEMMSNKASPCLQCHAIGASKPSGSGPNIVNGPDLRQVADRFRPGYLEEWIANPRRLIPYTAMPQNIVPHGAIQMPVPKTFENQPMEMVRAIRDTLLNYVDAVELQLAGGGAPKTAATSPAPSGVKTSSASP